MAHTVLCKVGIQRHKPHPNQDPETPEAIPTRLVQIAFPDAEGQEYQSEQDRRHRLERGIREAVGGFSGVLGASHEEAVARHAGAEDIVGHSR